LGTYKKANRDYALGFTALQTYWVIGALTASTSLTTYTSTLITCTKQLNTSRL